MHRNSYLLLPIVFLLGLFIYYTALTAPASTLPDKDKVASLDTDPNLVGWWKFDEESGKTVADSSKHKRKGELKGDLSFEKDSVPGRIGKALRLDEDNEYIQITNYKGVIGTKARTISAWVKTTGRQGEFVSWGFDDFGQMFIFGIIRRSGVGITPNGGYLYSGWTVNDDNWHHVAVVVDDVELPNLHDDVRIYQDGKLAEIHDIGLLDLWPINTG
ncbi:MAG: LamG-like jellyroll fold domain-containing protein, partial [Planctomycetota bacterium]